MFISKKALALVAVTTAGAQAYKASPQPTKTVNRQSFLQQAGAAGAAVLISATAGVLPSDAATFDGPPQQWEYNNRGRNEYSLNSQFDSRANRNVQRGVNRNFGNSEVMKRNMQQKNNLMSRNNAYGGRNGYNLNTQFDSRPDKNVNKNFGNRERMNRNKQDRNNYMASNFGNRERMNRNNQDKNNFMASTNAYGGRNDYNLNTQFNSRDKGLQQRGMNKNFGNREGMNRNTQNRNNLMSTNSRFNRIPTPKVVSWPETQYLVPIQELDNSLAMLKREVTSNRGAEGIQEGSRMLDNFFQKSNNKNTFKGLASAYSKNIKFQNPGDNVARQFERSFINDADETIGAMEDVRGKLRTLARNGAKRVTPDVLASIDKAQYGVRNILNKVPQSDANQARSLAKTASFNDRNAWLEGDQMQSLANNEKNVYNRLKSYV